MNKSAKNEGALIVIVIVVIALVFVLGYLSLNKKDSPSLETVQIYPPSLITGSQNPATISFRVNNPTLVDFSGRTEFIYDADCLEISPVYKDKEVFARAQNEQGFSQFIKVKNSNSPSMLPDKCFQLQSIFLRLKDINSSRIYDTKEIKLSITHP